jgi:signal transduction histidine kinase/ActR/RegA family two-component response regulator
MTQRANPPGEEIAVAAPRQERIDAVLDAGDAIWRASDTSAGIEALARAVVPRFASFCAVALPAESGRLELAALAHVAPEREAEARAIRRRAADHPAPSVTERVFRTGQPALHPDVDAMLLRELSGDDPERLRALTALGLRSLLVVPLVARNETMGALTLASTTDELRYDSTDLRLASKLASRAALMLYNAKLIRELRARGDAEKRVARRLRTLAEASPAFGEARLDVRPIAEALAGIVAAELGDGAVVYRLAEESILEPLAVRMADPTRHATIAEAAMGLRRDANEGLVGEALRLGRPVVLADREAIRRSIPPVWAAHLAAFPDACVAAVPLRAQGEVLGVLTVTRDARPPYDDDDLALFQDLADRAAIAMANARLHAAETEARRHVERLQTVTSALAKAISPDEVARVGVDHAQQELAGEMAFLHERSEDGREIVLVAQRGVPDALAQAMARIPTDASGVLAAVLRGKQPVFTESPVAYAARFPESAAFLAKLAPVGAFMSIPLAGLDGDIGGVLSIAFSEARVFGAVDRAFAINLADQCAQAMARARLYAAEGAAKRQAEEANRLKDEFLATVSHELRTPLNAILGWASLLRSGRLDREAAEKAFATIERNARAQARLVDDVLDVSRIISGKLAIRADLVDVRSVLQQALEVVRPAALAKHISVETEIPADLRSVRGDADRLQQVYWNLLSNAVKFTPREGRIRVCARDAAGEVEVSVTDDGPGIAPEFLPHVFDAFRQADGSPTRAHGGLGLGHSIAKHLAQLHGGTIEATSDGPGTGATFTVTIPASAQTAAPHATSKVRRAARLVGVDVLVVDDDADVRDLAAIALSSEGASVRTAASAREAMARVVERAPAILVCDIGMPGEDGLSLLPRARAASARPVPAIAFTAYADAEHAALVKKAGYEAHLAMPVDADALVAAVARAADDAPGDDATGPAGPTSSSAAPRG